MQALNNWGGDNSESAWGIIKAILCGLGAIPGYIIAAYGKNLMHFGE